MNVSMRTNLDVSRLPTYAFGHRSLMWWGTWSMMIIEGTVIAIALVVYFYLRQLGDAWPLAASPPDLLFGTVNLALVLASAWPNHWTKRAAEAGRLRAARAGLLVCLGFAAVILVVRAFEFTTLHTRWDANAYGSIVYAVITLHTAHLLTDFVDTAVLVALLFREPVEGKGLVDVGENALYWYFVVITWIPVYLTLYVAPRVY